jgi:hypothetical protein
MSKEPTPKPAPLPPCNTCRWFVARALKDNYSRCHAAPPYPRVPYHDQSSWPVVPETGGGCRLWEERK